MTGTAAYAYHPPGSILAETGRATGDYEPWTPE